MSFASFGKRFAALGYDVLRNPFFWGGVGILLLTTGALYVVVDKVVMPNYTRHGVSVEVPNVRNEDVESARAELRELGLRIEEEQGQYNPSLPRNVVLDQSPAPNTPIKPNRRVYLTLNQGEVPEVVLPDNLVSLARRVARSRLQELQLDVEMRQDSIPAANANTVTRHTPGPGDTVKVGSTVTLWYSAGLGEENVNVPSVLGLSLAEARRQLQQGQLRPFVLSNSDRGFCDDASEADEDATSTQDEDALFVCYQGTSPDTEVRAGSEVRLGVTPDSTAVPDSTTANLDSVQNTMMPEETEGGSTSERVPSW
ncbi:penicillin-binding protein [Longimonas halophila]|uniref:Penicillin-binding protein n=1 Tax=Longimonas halophila TaxID=1469170 RepID=A0A2H3NSA6_9BACT|nr:PASTA domain-containing protein [Longimonas halophila]PEN08869.1 penicillin-binding protein [Longimonas halophila]